MASRIGRMEFPRIVCFFFFQAEDGIRDKLVTGVQTCDLPIWQGASEAMGPLLGAFERVHRQRDLGMVDQRGTGRSHPLRCDLHDRGASLAERLSGGAMMEERFRKCLAAYDADPRLYTTAIAMQDLDEVRAALGYDQIDLWGGS